jgi:hypothetical protein
MRTKPESPEQKPLATALASVCAAPIRAEHDPAFGDPGARNDTLNKHLSDNVTYPEVLEKIETWKHPDKTTEQKLAELDELLKRAGLATKCRLQEVWADPDWGASELEPGVAPAAP